MVKSLLPSGKVLSDPCHKFHCCRGIQWRCCIYVAFLSQIYFVEQFFWKKFKSVMSHVPRFWPRCGVAGRQDFFSSPSYARWKLCFSGCCPATAAYGRNIIFYPSRLSMYTLRWFAWGRIWFYWQLVVINRIYQWICNITPLRGDKA